MENSLEKMFMEYLRKRDCTVSSEGDHVAFENEYLTGKVSLKKPFTVRWRCKRGYQIFDVPVTPGNASASFKDVGATLSFIKRCLLR